MGTRKFSWHDLRIIIEHSPRSSAVVQSQDPESANWSLDALLLAEVADSLKWLQWAKTKDGQRNRNPPKPIPRPGVQTDEPKRITGTPEDVDDIVAWLGDDFADFAIAA